MPTKSDMVAGITDNLRRVFQVVNERSKKAERETGLTGPQLWSIKLIADSGPLKISELARRMYLHPATVGGILDRLETKGFVFRTRSRSDRRVVRVDLTAEGKGLVEKAPEVAQGLLVAGLVKLSGEKLRTILAGLTDMVKILGAQEIPPQLLLSSEVNQPGQKRKLPQKHDNRSAKHE